MRAGMGIIEGSGGSGASKASAGERAESEDKHGKNHEAAENKADVIDAFSPSTDENKTTKKNMKKNKQKREIKRKTLGPTKLKKYTFEKKASKKTQQTTARTACITRDKIHGD